jgi:DNA-binding MarR family transcriptional regulator
MSVLAEYLGLEKSTLSGLVDRAARKGLVRREPSASDGRAIDVSLLPDGLRLADTASAEVRNELGPIVDRLDGPEQQVLQALLARLLPALPGEGPQSH